jgi:UDP-N-acetylglucosamine:LPS N-acetylglucosamine transferase
MGAGHDGAARELVRRLQTSGHDAEMRDFMRSAPLGIGTLIRRIYELQMRHAPWTYDLTYRMWTLLPFLCPPLGIGMGWLTGRRMRRWATAYRADVVVSTYPLASTVLGRLRQTGRLPIPVVNFITDFGVHPLWVHPDVDLNMAVHPAPAVEATARGAGQVIATGPLVSSRFRGPEDRDAARAELRLGRRDRAVLIVAGSWGVGEVAKTFRAIADGGRFVPVAVCGRDERLRRRLDRVPGGRALGWRDDMPTLMAASDALVENAGGLTSMEALSVGLPIISFRPIAGHGKQNTAEMDKAGVSLMARSPAQLMDLLDLVTEPGPTRVGMVEAGRAMFASDPAEHVLELAGGAAQAPAGRDDRSPSTADGDAGPVATGPRRPSVLVARIAAAVAAVPLLWAALTSGVGVATAYGAGVARPGPNVGPVAYLGVRLDQTELEDPVIQQQLASLGATAVVDRSTAELDPGAVQHLVSIDVDVESGGAGTPPDSRGHRLIVTPWERAHVDVQSCALLTRIVGQPVKVVVPGRRLNAFDLVASYTAHSRTVVPDQIVGPDDAGDPSFHVVAHHIYLVNGVRATPVEVRTLLEVIAEQLSLAGLRGAPLVELH